MRIQIVNYSTPAPEKLEDFVSYYQDDKILKINIAELTDGTIALSDYTGTSATVDVMMNNVIKDADFLYAVVTFDRDLDATGDDVRVYLIVSGKSIVTLGTRDAEILRQFMEDYIKIFDDPAGVSVGISGTRAVITANDVSATITISDVNEVSNTLNFTLDV